jgi:hypothetical protein
MTNRRQRGKYSRWTGQGITWPAVTGERAPEGSREVHEMDLWHLTRAP